MKPDSLGDTLLAARKRLAAALLLDASVAGLEAQALLGHVLKQPRAYLLAHPEATLSAEITNPFEALLIRRLRGEPIAYLIGQREFYGFEFLVTPDVLIPRPETELLLEQALAHTPHIAPMRILDLGVGSGAIAISLAKLRPHAQITALDISPQALAIAQQNADRLGAPNIRFMESNWFSKMDAACRFEVIVANPPYLAEDDPHLYQGDVRFEPVMALTSGADGLDAIRHIAQASLLFLPVGGRLLFEHGYNQGALCSDLLTSLGYADISSFQDLSGHSRVTSGKKP